MSSYLISSLLWRHNGRDGVSNHQPHDCLLNRSFERRSKKTSKLRVTDLCVGNSPVTGEFPTQMASNAESVSIWWRYLVIWWEENEKKRNEKNIKWVSNLLQSMVCWCLNCKMDWTILSSLDKWQCTCVAPVNVVTYHKCINGKKLIHLW